MKSIRWILFCLTLLPGGLGGQTVDRQASGTTARLQAVSVVSERVVWASGTQGTYILTTDGGAHWKAAVVPGADSLEFRDVHAFDARRAVLLASGPGEKSRLYHTTDGGASWALVFTNSEPKAFYDCLDFRGAVGVVVSDAVGGLFPLLRTEDSGASWSPYRPAGYANVSAIEGEGAFAASGTCLALDARGGVWVGTAKGGRVLRFGPDQSSAVVTPVVRDLPSAGIATVAFRSEVIGLVAGGDLSRPNDFTDNVAITRDGGRTWALTGRPSFPGSVYGLAYLPSRPGTVVAVGPRGASWSSDDGATWRALDSGNYWGIGFSRTGIGWLTGPDGSIVRVTF